MGRFSLELCKKFNQTNYCVMTKFDHRIGTSQNIGPRSEFSPSLLISSPLCLESNISPDTVE